MKTYPLDEARTALPELVERALRGEPQRVTRGGEEAVVIVSEADWARRPRGAATLGELLLRHAGEEGYADVFDRGEPIARQDRPLGADFLSDD